jgi:chromosomal replication initiator protein
MNTTEERHLWQECHNQILLLREQLDRIAYVLRCLNPNMDAVSLQADLAQLIQKWVCERFSVTHRSMTSRCRQQRFVRPRWLAMWLIRRHCTELTLVAIGSIFGGRDHGTVLHGITNVENYASVNPRERQFLDDLDAACIRFIQSTHPMLLPAA